MLLRVGFVARPMPSARTRPSETRSLKDVQFAQMARKLQTPPAQAHPSRRKPTRPAPAAALPIPLRELLPRRIPHAQCSTRPSASCTHSARTHSTGPYDSAVHAYKYISGRSVHKAPCPGHLAAYAVLVLRANDKRFTASYSLLRLRKCNLD